MEVRLLRKSSLPGLIGKLSVRAKIYGPAREGDDVHFRVLERGETPLLDYPNTRNAPKQFLFPPREELMRYTRLANNLTLTDRQEEVGESLLFGVRPCDARSFVLLDKVFDQERYRDPYYIDRRKKTTVLAVTCVRPPFTTCFCAAVGGSPTSREGADIIFTDVGDAYLVEFVTAKGERWLPQFSNAPAADEAALARQKDISLETSWEMKSLKPAASIKPVLDRIFEHPFWDTIHSKCLKCGTCTYLCPTCHCFDISDEMKGNDGVRIRNWDSCMYPLFTLATSGHNPRPTQKERWRQRVMHKFRYFVDNFGSVACVGCGRCVMSCPVNIDIRKIISDIAEL